MKLPQLFMLAGVILCLCLSSDAEARRYRKAVSGPRFGSARPVTGYGANLHRRFILKQEAQRVLQGKSVRHRGNIRWYR